MDISNVNITNKKDANDFIKIAKKCKGTAIIKTSFGDIYNLKSEFMRFIIVDAMLNFNVGKLELICSNKEDEEMFKDFFEKIC